jgi:c-di-GMP-binding flagellar brake protein YcgR
MPRAMQTEMRLYPRIRVGRGSDLRASVSVDEKQYDPLVEDLSLGGTLITFPDTCPSWKRGTLVRVRLVLGLAQLTLIATVVREAQGGYGLTFNRFRASADQQQQKLQQILSELERQNA